MQRKITIKEQLAKANCSVLQKGEGERLGTLLNELWPSPIYIIDEILGFILTTPKKAPLKSAL
ncbi:hypothetical protein ABH17_028090 (plasmid) [Bacillus toyonensis]|nr:hypothetical protein ABH17_028090 [Bacillus toyonensis]PEB28715.1 hypothetical protein COO14_19720 [Bacillus toyonensis]